MEVRLKSAPLIWIALGALLVCLVWLAWPIAQADAQCGTSASSCKNCHEIQGQYPVSNIGDWHKQHAFGDFCGFCHGGDMKAEDKPTAHIGLAHPLEDVTASCAACHPDDCDGRAQQYAAALGVSVGKGIGTTPRQQTGPFLGSTLRPAGPNPAIVTPGAPVQPAATPAGAASAANPRNAIAALLAFVLVIAGGGYVLWNEGALRLQPHQVIAYIKKEEWSPYVAGIVLGLVAILVVVASTALHNPEIALSASAPFQSILGGIANLVAPEWVARNVYYRGVMTPGVTWGVLLLLGMVIGGALSAISSGAWKLRWMPEKQWSRAYGPSRIKRWLLVFVGTIILQIGAGIAGGCTSGLAIWGGWQLAPAAFLFMGGMFASGILTALIVYRGRY